MNFLRDTSIKRKQVFVILLTTSLALLLACAAFATYDVITFRRNVLTHLKTLCEIIGDTSSGALDSNDRKHAEENLAELRYEPDITGACIYTKEGAVFAVYDRATGTRKFQPPPFQPSGTMFNKLYLGLYDPIDYSGKVNGTIYIASDMKTLVLRLEQYAVIVAIVFFLSMLVAFGLSATLQHVISQPILRLLETARAVVNEKNYSLRAVKNSDDEIGALIGGFNDMLSEIQARDTELQKAHGDLERRVDERTQELANSLSLLNATLESTTDGIIAVDLSGQVTSFNKKFLNIWQFPSEIVARANVVEMRDYSARFIKDSGRYLQHLADLQANPETAVCDTIEFKDGRVFERYFIPQRINKVCVGSVINWRDVTERIRAEEALRASATELRTLAESMPQIVWMARPDGWITYINKRLVDYSGMTLDECLGRGWSQLIHPEDQEAVAKSWGQSIAEGTDHNMEARLRRADGIYRWMLVRAVTLRDENGVILKWMGTCTDIHDLKEAGEALREKTALFEAQAESTQDGILIVDKNGRRLFCNRRFIEIWSIPRSVLEENDDRVMVEYAVSQAVDPDQFVQKVLYLYSHPEEVSHDEVHLKNGLTLDRYSSPVLSKDKVHYGRIWTFRDVTESKRAAAELETAHKQLLDISRQAGMAEVATSVLHNVGNVLNSVNVSKAVICEKVRTSKVPGLAKAAELLDANKEDLAQFFGPDGKGRQLPAYLTGLASRLRTEQEEITVELNSLSANIEHIKEIVSMQQSYASVSGLSEEHDVISLVEDAVRMNAGALDRHEVRLIREYNAVPKVHVDKHKVLQILVNLIRNGKYALDDGKPDEKRMILCVGPNGGESVSISVIDNGIGIPEENLTRIFAHGFTTRKNGHGFGLHSGALAAKALGGSLAVHSSGLGKGASFTLELPCNRLSSN